MVCCGLKHESWLAVATALSTGAVTSLFLAAVVHSSNQYLDPKHTELVRKRPLFAVYALINNVACERCGTSKSLLEQVRNCLPRTVNLQKPVCMREEQYLKEYGENAVGVIECYRENLFMKPDQLQCLLDANHMEKSPGYPITPNMKETKVTMRPEVVTTMRLDQPRKSFPVRKPSKVHTKYSRIMDDPNRPYYTTSDSLNYNFDDGSSNRWPWTEYPLYRTTQRRRRVTIHWLEEILREEIKKRQQQKNKNNRDTGWPYIMSGAEPNDGDDFRPDGWVHYTYPRRPGKA